MRFHVSGARANTEAGCTGVRVATDKADLSPLQVNGTRGDHLALFIT